MKLLNYSLIILSFLIYLSSCKESKADPLATLSASPTTISIVADGGTASLAITSNTSWTISSDQPWCKTSMQTANGDATVEISVDKNNIVGERIATLTLGAKGANTVKVLVTQSAKAPEIAPDPTGMQPELSAMEFSQLLGLGWNLGNSLEAISATNGNFTGDETTWGNPVITKQLIDSVKAAGFNVVRIPVSWSNHLVEPGTYKIKQEWMQRVAEVVDYVIGNDMYAMINIHWDGGWMDHPTYDKKTEINTKIDSLWKQIAFYFQDYDAHLLFAGTNEVGMNWAAPTTENAEVQNSFNQTFVSAVRATGGRNAYRFLVVQGYYTNIGYTRDYFIKPNDAISDRLMVEIHFYDPYEFALKTDAGYNTGWGTGQTDVTSWGQEAWVDEAFGYMKTKFIDNGIPVVMGEYGAVLRSNLTGAVLTNHLASRNYYLEYVTQKAVDNKIVPFYWDNGYNGNNGFALFDRNTGRRLHNEAIEAITKALNK